MSDRVLQSHVQGKFPSCSLLSFSCSCSCFYCYISYLLCYVLVKGKTVTSIRYKLSLSLSLSLSLWLYKDSGSRNTIYASFARYIMRVLAPIHAHNINSLAFSLSLNGFIRIPAHGTLYMSALLVTLCVFWLPFTRIILTA